MKEKLELLLAEKRLNATSLARILDIQPSGISHILSGRNKPSFDFVVKILRAFPDINPDWLLLDSQTMLRDAANSEKEDTLFSHPDIELHSEQRDEENKNIEISAGYSYEKNEQHQNFANRQNSTKEVERLLVLYTDGSFDSYSK